MPVTYEPADADVNGFVTRVMAQYHSALRDLDTTVEILMAFPPRDANGDATGPALKYHGVKAYVVIRQTKPDERALGHADVRMKIDAEFWEESSAEARTALIDHELNHIAPKIKDGAVVRDAYDRPLFVTRSHDWEVGWFFAVAARHGRNSIECHQLNDLLESDAYRDSFAPSVTVPPPPRRRLASTGEL